MGTEAITMTQHFLFSLKSKVAHIFTLLSLLLVCQLHLAQTNTDSLAVCYSTYLGGNSQDAFSKVKVAPDGSVYVIGLSHSTNFPVTQDAVQSEYSGGDVANAFQSGFVPLDLIGPNYFSYNNIIEYDLFISKFSPTGTLIYSTYWGGSSWEGSFDFLFDNSGALYIAFTSFSETVSVPAGTQEYAYGNADSEIKTVVTKFSPSGQVVFNTVIQGLSYRQIFTSPASNNTLLFNNAKLNNLHLDANGNLFIVGLANSFFFTSSDAAQSTIAGASDAAFCKINPDGSLQYASFWGGDIGSPSNDMNKETKICSILTNEGDLIISGTTSVTDFPVSQGCFQAELAGGRDLFLAKFNNSGALIFSTYLGGLADEGYTWSDELNNYIVTDELGNIYMSSRTNSLNFPVSSDALFDQNLGAVDVFLSKFSPTGNLLYSSYLGGSGNEFLNDFQLKNGSLYIAGSTASANFPTTPGVTQANFGMSNQFTSRAFVMRLDLDGQILFSTFWGGTTIQSTANIHKMQISANGNITFLGNTGPTMNVTDNVPQPNPLSNGSNNCYFAGLTNSGQLLFSTYWGKLATSSWNYIPADIFVDDLGVIYLTKTTNDSTDWANNNFDDILITPDAFQQNNAFDEAFNTVIGESFDGQEYLYPWPQVFSGFSDVTLSIFKPLAIWENTTNFISPSIITGCLGGPSETIVGNPVGSAGGFAPQYQWQFSSIDPNDPDFDPNNDWQNIPFALQQNYTPTILSTDRWYRRVLFSTAPLSCGTITNEPYDLSYSNVTLVQGSTLIAPQINAGQNIFTCPNTATQIGLNASVSSGTPPYQINWDFENFLNNNEILNPTAIVPSSTVFTVEIVDANGCNNFGQMVLFAFELDAGTSTTICLGDTVQLGSLPNVGEPASYSWSPSAGLSCVDCPMPVASPIVTTTYTVTKTITLPDGSTCQYADNVTITLPQNPTPLEDIVVCHDPISNEFQLGNEDLAGYNYSWFPQQWLTDFNTAEPTFNSENYFLYNSSPQLANPFTYYRTTTNGQCTWTDSMNVYMIRAKIGEDGCGPSVLGYDWHPQIPATYTWTCLSGDCNFSGPLNEATTYIEEPTTQSAFVQLEVCFMGLCCTDVVEVKQCDLNSGSCQGNSIYCNISASYDPICPTLPVTLFVEGEFVNLPPFIDPSDAFFVWSPSQNFSDPFAQETELILNDQLYYVVTISHPFLIGEFCTDTLVVPVVVPPVFNPNGGVLCNPGDVANIGSAAVSNYVYNWIGPNGETYDISNPIVSNPGWYFYEVTDTITYCVLIDSILVTNPVVADAGPDQIVCPASIVEIGTPDLSNGVWQYFWEPSFAPWQNGTDEFSPQAQVFVATDLTFVLTVTDLITGCFAVDTVDVFIDIDSSNISFDDVSICFGSQTVIGPEPIFGALYSWTPPLGLSCTDCPNPIASPSMNTTYSVSIALPGDCVPYFAEISVEVIESTSFDLTDITKCPQEIISLNPNQTGACAGCSYSWSPSVGLNNSTLLNPNCSIDEDNSYNLTITDAFGCQSSGTMDVYISAAANISLDAQEKCPQQAIALNPNLVGCAACSYSWFPLTGLSDPTSQNPTTNSNSVSQYTLTITYPNGCQEQGIVNLTVSPPVYLAPQTVNKCKMSSVPINPNLIGQCSGCSYSWSNGLGNSINPNVSFQNNTTVFLTITQANGCEEILEVNVVIEQPTLIQIPPVYKCQSGSVPLNPNSIGQCAGCTYQWSPAIQISNALAINPNTTRTTNGSYTLTVTQANGCQLQGIVEVIIIPNMPLEIPPVYKCVNETVPLNPNLVGSCVGCTYNWTPNFALSSNNIVNPNTSRTTNGFYTLTVNNTGNDCPSSGQVQVIITPPDPLSIPDVVTCGDGSPTPINPDLIGACAGCTYSWSPSAGLSSTNVINPTTIFPDAVYTLTVNKPDGCQEQGVVIVYHLTPTPLTSYSVICLGASIALGVDNPNPNSVYSWSPANGLSNISGPLTTFTPTNLGLHEITLAETLTLSSGQSCSVTTNVSVFVNGVDINSTTSFINICENTCANIGPIPQNGVSYYWMPSDDLSCTNCPNPLACPDVNAQYTLTAIDDVSGCSSQTVVTFNLYDIPIPESSIDNVSTCGGENVVLNLSVSPNGQYAYSWSPNNLVSNPSIQNPVVNTGNLNLGDNLLTVNVTDNFTGCSGIIDSVYINILGFNTTVELNIITCEPSYNAPYGVTYTNSGYYTFTEIDSEGCFTDYELNLSINQPEEIEVYATSCESYVWNANNITYTESGVYIETLQNTAGCDSIITLNLTINQATYSSIDRYDCESYFWGANGQTYTEPGTYTHVLTNSAGCDSILTLNLVLSDFEVNVVNNNNISLSATDGVNFQWVNCPLFDEIQGETNQVFVVTQNGNYAVIAIDNDGCIDTSLCVLITGVGLEDFDFVNSMIYPNPTFDFITVVFSSASAVIELYDASGRLIRSTTMASGGQLSLENEQSGVYFVRIISENLTAVHRVVKQQ